MLEWPANFLLVVPACLAVGLIFEMNRADRQRCVFTGRPPVPDGAFLRAVGAGEADDPLWLAVRRVFAESCGLGPEAIRADDRLADLWRCLWDGPDHLDLVFRLERLLRIKIRRGDMDATWRAATGDLEFGAFAGLVVRDLRRITA